MSELVIGPNNPNIDFRLHNYHDSGWYFGSGDPEFWKFSDRMLKPGGKLLDIGMGEARCSMYFALNGMDVTGVDSNPKRIRVVSEMAEDLSRAMPINMRALQLDALKQPLPDERYDTVVIGQVVHLPSKQAAFDLFDNALSVLKPGGHIWVRGAGKESYSYAELSWQASRPWSVEFHIIDKDVIEHPCECSGEYLIEPTLFFDPLDLNAFFASRGCNIIHSQTIPTDDKMNIMYGEDYNPEYPVYRGGMVTVLAQKPQL